MKTYFGVKSAVPANKTLKNGYTLYDWVKRQKCFPKFWGRTLLGSSCVTKEEIEFLKGKDCKVFFVIRDLTEKAVSGVSGTQDALRAAEAAKQLGIPQNKGIALFAEIKPEWSVNHNWMLSFAHTLVACGYTPGFIGNTDSSKNFNFDRQCSHFVQASKHVNNFGAVFMATEPKTNKMPTEWRPYCPSALNPEDIHLWSCSKTKFDKIRTEDVYARDQKVLENMW